MTIWAISDLHLSFGTDKPMDVFGSSWEGHAQKIKTNWERLVAPDDTVCIAGDISWAMNFEQALFDLEWIDKLPGKKIITRGNHDYWWKKIKWLRANLPSSIYPLQNDHVLVEGRTICGCRGWTIPVEGSESFEEDCKLFERERARLLLSIDSAKNRNNTIVMIHFPPFAENTKNPDFTDILEKKEVSSVIYGHLHAKDAQGAFSGMRNGINYIFTSSDGIDFCPVMVE